VDKEKSIMNDNDTLNEEAFYRWAEGLLDEDDRERYEIQIEMEV